MFGRRHALQLEVHLREQTQAMAEVSRKLMVLRTQIDRIRSEMQAGGGVSEDLRIQLQTTWQVGRAAEAGL